MIMLGWVPRETVSGLKSGALRFAGPCFRQQHLRGRGAQDWAEGGQSVLQLQHGTPLTPGGALGLRCQLETSYIETGGPGLCALALTGYEQLPGRGCNLR